MVFQSVHGCEYYHEFIIMSGTAPRSAALEAFVVMFAARVVTRLQFVRSNGRSLNQAVITSTETDVNTDKQHLPHVKTFP